MRSDDEQKDIGEMSDGGLRILKSHLKAARDRLDKAKGRLRMHDVRVGLGDGDCDWHTGAARGQVAMAIDAVNEEEKRRREDAEGHGDE